MDDVPATVRARALTHAFRGKPALAGLDLDVARGTACALVGRNGAGKSTAIRIVLGLLAPTSGSIRVLGLDPLRDRRQLRLRTGIVLDRLTAWPRLFVRDVLALCAGCHPRWDEAEARRLAETFSLPLDARVKDLSRGESAQVSLTIGAASKPDLLVLDEPTSGLDPVVRHAFVREVRRAVEQRGATVLFTTHVMSDVDGAADDVVVVERGRMLARGAPRDLASRFGRVSLLFDAPPPPDVVVPRASRVTRGVREIVATFTGAPPPLAELAAATGARDARVVPLSFDDTFLEIQRDAGSAP